MAWLRPVMSLPRASARSSWLYWSALPLMLGVLISAAEALRPVGCVLPYLGQIDSCQGAVTGQQIVEVRSGVAGMGADCLRGGPHCCPGRARTTAVARTQAAAEAVERRHADRQRDGAEWRIVKTLSTNGP